MKRRPQMNLRHNLRQRRGVAVFWLVLVLPLVVLLLVLAVEVGRQWTERAALENSLEASALAAAWQWGRAPSPRNRPIASALGTAYARANLVDGHQTRLAEENFVYGWLEVTPTGNVFHVGQSNNRPGMRPCVYCRAQQPVPALTGVMSERGVLAHTAASYDRTTNRVRLERIDSFRSGGVPIPLPGIPVPTPGIPGPPGR